MNNMVKKHYGELMPGDMVIGNERAMMVVSSVPVGNYVKVQWMKLWGYDGFLFKEGPFNERLYFGEHNLIAAWQLSRSQ